MSYLGDELELDLAIFTLCLLVALTARQVYRGFIARDAEKQFDEPGTGSTTLGPLRGVDQSWQLS